MDVKQQTKPAISVITATYNAAEHLPKLIKSLQQQTDQDFEWVIADGGSTDGTLELIQQITDLNIKLTSQADFGIYDALNRGIKQCSGDYYVVAGADDYFYHNAIAEFRLSLLDEMDIALLAANTKIGEQLIKPKGKVWLNGMKAHIAAHSVGTLINKQLHNNIGYYSKLFPIAADELFILMVAKNNLKIKHLNTEVGFHSAIGLSSINVIGSLLESFRVRLLVGENKYIQLLLIILRLLKNITRY